MRILFDSKQLIYKDPFGTLVPDQTCTLNIHIPSSVQATAVTCIVTHEDGSEAFSFPLTYKIKKGAYEIFPPHRKLPRVFNLKKFKRYPLSIIFGEPISPEGKTDVEITAEIRRQIVEMKER